ncbi:MAG: amidohydrolase family protein [Candidatus Levyibacteriota bacterium]
MTKIVLPGLIDPHVHLRDPEQTHKEDFYSGTMAAIAGGFTTVLDMPNNKIPITTLKVLKEKMKIAKKLAVCDIGFYFGSLGDNLDELASVSQTEMAFGLKLYLERTTGNFLIKKNALARVFSAWRSRVPVQKPILVHAEKDTATSVLRVAKKIILPVHFCHISTASELKLIIAAKNQGLPVTCGVTPHHLFLTRDDVKTLGPFGKIRPPLRSKKDVTFLWKNLKWIDVIESDHAPHTIEEKKSKVPPYGVPGLETTLPLLLTAVSEKRLTIDDIIRLCFKNPSKIFGIFGDKKTKIEINLSKSYRINPKSLFTKCAWSPFDGWKVKGKVEKVTLRGIKVFQDGKILVRPGFGKIIKPRK